MMIIGIIFCQFSIKKLMLWLLFRVALSSAQHRFSCSPDPHEPFSNSALCYCMLHSLGVCNQWVLLLKTSFHGEISKVGVASLEKLAFCICENKDADQLRISGPLFSLHR